jgi:hypothetical protein
VNPKLGEIETFVGKVLYLSLADATKKQKQRLGLKMERG